MTDITILHRNHYTCGDYEVRGVVGDCSPGNGRLVRPAQPDETPQVWGLYTTRTGDSLPMHVRDLPTLAVALEKLAVAATKPATHTVYVVEFAPTTDGGVGGWDWYRTREAATDRVRDLLEETPELYVAVQAIEVQDLIDYDITAHIEDSGRLVL